jgi:GT2 family glycosyltransferase
MSVEEKFPPSVLVVILNWNGWEETMTSAGSVVRLNYANLRLLVIDNGSTDASVKQLRTICDDRVELLELPENRGYTGGCNEGFRRAIAAGTDYVWLLNSDAVVEGKDTLTSLVALAEGDPKIGLVSPRLAEAGEGGRLSFCGAVCSIKPLFMDQTWDPEEARSWAQKYPFAAMVPGTAMLVRTSVIREIGMLDERFFTYWEDIDYSYRSSAAGYRNLVDENCVVGHPRKDPILNPSALKPHWWYYNARNEYWFWTRHMGAFRALKPSWWAFRKMMQHMNRCPEDQRIMDATLAGFWHGWINRRGPYRPESRMPRPLAALIRRIGVGTSRPGAVEA